MYAWGISSKNIYIKKQSPLKQKHDSDQWQMRVCYIFSNVLFMILKIIWHVDVMKGQIMLF